MSPVSDDGGKTPDDIPFARPAIGSEEIEAVSAVLRSGWLTTGSEALAFEREFADFVGCRYALAVNSATAGLHLSLEAHGVGPGSVVIVPSLTFTATAEVARYLGAEVVFADTMPESLLVDPAHVDHLAGAAAGSGKNVGAIIPVHFAGEVCEMAPFREIGRRHGAVVVEDAAHAFPSRTDEGYAGTLGDAGVFSFYANKTITTGEGGMICVEDPTLERRIRTMRTHGIDRDAWDRYRNARGQWYYQVVAPGYKYNMPDTAAAIGRVQLRRAEALLRTREEAVGRYRRLLAPLEASERIGTPAPAPGHAWHLFVVRLAAGIDRDAVIRALAEAGIGTSVHYIPLHRMPYWARHSEVSDRNLPNTTAIADRILSLPLYPGLTEAQQGRVVEALTAAVGVA
jgi:dTDP-4-amino-4,6-dideoxygalactose transaminase